MKKLAILAAMLLMPFAAQATYSSDYSSKSYSTPYKKYSSSSYYGTSYSKYSSGSDSKSHSHKPKTHTYGNPLVGHKMPKGCKWVWRKGKKETKCGKHSYKDKLAKFCKKYPYSKKCKKLPPVVGVSEPAPFALLALALAAAFFARRK